MLFVQRFFLIKWILPKKMTLKKGVFKQFGIFCLNIFKKLDFFVLAIYLPKN
jgi:hypothetical protein